MVVIPHAHNPGDFRQSHPGLEPLVEMMSMHGTFEWFMQEYLSRGHQVGVVAASDDHQRRFTWATRHAAGGTGAAN